MQEEEAAGFVPAVGNLWLAAPEHTLTHSAGFVAPRSSLAIIPPGFAADLRSADKRRVKVCMWCSKFSSVCF